MNQALEPIETVTLEVLRPGPSHGQLLSPLTLYVALCGDEGPVTLRIEQEHWRLMNRLQRLRYLTPDRRQGAFVAVPDPIRQSAVLELGTEVSRILASIPTLASELGRAGGRLGSDAAGGAGLVHLRLVISGSELSLIPFELVISPQGLPGDGLAMLLQTRMPIVITREVRRGTASEIQWNRSPRVLFIAAAPGSLDVPQRAHLHALRKALDPWVKWAPDPAGRLKSLAHLLTVKLDASIEDIEEACASNDYTHVHILAHGDTFDEAGQPRYGVALCNHRDRSQKVVVDGRQLAEALRVARKLDRTRSTPLVVSLATCDSGNVRSVAVPGGSIAHDLHAFGIPWVFASQFPLTKSGSIRMAELLYDGLLWGEDPRRLMHRMRSAMHVTGSSDHDWASMVAYASVPERLDVQVHWYRSVQMRKAVDVDLEHADDLRAMADDSEEGRKFLAQVDEAINDARRQLELWEKGLPGEAWERGLPQVIGAEARALRAECYGIFGATEKRAAGIYHALEDAAKTRNALERARSYYRRAMQTGMQLRKHWPATQYLSLTAVLAEDPDAETFDGTFSWASQDLASDEAETIAWAHGTLAELELLRLYHNPSSIRGRALASTIEQRVRGHCQSIVDLMGFNSFPVLSTRRQFDRYLSWWQRDLWKDVAAAAVAVLTLPGGAKPDSGG